ncbi:MAG: hypothetical protein LBF04_06395 [Prevotellaceae bacterium]|jgi:hypothetical protein|nr:hypothetical protein [Prevotellaceae bacterium]
MNSWTELSIEYAKQMSYLDDLFIVYSAIPAGIRESNEEIWGNVEKAFNQQSNDLQISELLNLDLFPIKDSNIACLKRDKTAIEHNLRTINRICGRLYESGLDKIYEQCSKPKESSRQIRPMFYDFQQYKKNENKFVKY